MFFAQGTYSYGGAWGTGPTALEALKNARQAVGMTAAEQRKSTHYVLEFPDGAEITVNDLSGGWSATTPPLRVERKHNTSATDAELLGTRRT